MIALYIRSLKKLFLIGFLLFYMPFLLLGQNDEIRFIENKGQWDQNIDFKAHIPGGSMWVEGNRLTFDYVDQQDLAKVHEQHLQKNKSNQDEIIVHHHAYRVSFMGTKGNSFLKGKRVINTKNNYFLGNDSTKWASDVSLFEQVLIENIYPGIDMLSYGSNGNFKYDFIVHPSGNSDNIRVMYEGIDQIQLKNNVIKLQLSVGDVFEHLPVAYQIINGKKKRLKCNFQINENEISFVFPKDYNRAYDVVIDPELIFSSYTGSTDDNWGFTATYDDSGNAYAGGIIYNASNNQSGGYPTTIGAYDVIFNGGGADVVISKFSPDGSVLIYSTYLGGNSSEVPQSMMVDSLGNLVVLGITSSNNFPVSTGAYDTNFNGGVAKIMNGISFNNGTDIFITKFDNLGSAVVGSTYFGGDGNDGLNMSESSGLIHNYGDEARGEIFIGDGGKIYVASNTFSSDFPCYVDAPANPSQDAVAACFTPELSELLWAVCPGGDLNDVANSIKEKNNMVYLAGGTSGFGFPITSGALREAYGGLGDGFAMVLDSEGETVYSTYIGTEAFDQVYFVELDEFNHVYLMGQTEGDFPVSDAVYSNENGSQFVQSLTPDLDSSRFSTTLGSGTDEVNISPTAFLVDECGYIYISGWGGETNHHGNTNDMPITDDAFQSTTDGSDFYFMVLDRNAKNLFYATYFGSNNKGSEHVDGGTSRFDKHGVIYQAVCASCGGFNNSGDVTSDDFPTTSGVVSNVNGSDNCNLAIIKMIVKPPGLKANITVNDTMICHQSPYEIQFYGSGVDVPYHFWDFGDGKFSNEPNPVHSYDNAGDFVIRYVVVDSSTCEISDTAYTNFEIIQKESFTADWIFTEPKTCIEELHVAMAFTGTGADSLVWNMGDETFYYENAIEHDYFVPGYYEVQLSAFDFDCGGSAILIQPYEVDGGIENGMIEFPNIFTPNADGINDLFHAYYPEEPGSNPLRTMERYQIRIYDRWGRLVYASTDDLTTAAWDGKVDGNQAAEGVYFYIVEYDSNCDANGIQRKTGYVTLLR